jgi:hypothetical protein
MSHRNVNRPEENIKDLSLEMDNELAEVNEEVNDNSFNEESEEASFNGLELRVERLKNDVKNLKKIKKQQEKLGKLEEKKVEILSEIEREQDRERRSKNRHDKRKR